MSKIDLLKQLKEEVKKVEEKLEGIQESLDSIESKVGTLDNIKLDLEVMRAKLAC